jgi:hypothetical protein
VVSCRTDEAVNFAAAGVKRMKGEENLICCYGFEFFALFSWECEK